MKRILIFVLAAVVIGVGWLVSRDVGRSTQAESSIARPSLGLSIELNDSALRQDDQSVATPAAEDLPAPVGHSIFEPASGAERDRFEPWIENFFDTFPAGSVWIVAYDVVALDESTLEQIRRNELTEFTFNLVEPYQIEMLIANVEEEPDFWHFSAIPKSGDGGALIISVEPDGSFAGSFVAPGIGVFNIVPTETPRYQFVYLANGVVEFD